jgi:hypothetical protein
MPYLALVATRDIPAFVELTFDYNPAHQAEYELKKYREKAKAKQKKSKKARWIAVIIPVIGSYSDPIFNCIGSTFKVSYNNRRQALMVSLHYSHLRNFDFLSNFNVFTRSAVARSILTRSPRK